MSYEALWRILWPKFVGWAEQESTDINISDKVNNVIGSFENVSVNLSQTLCKILSLYGMRNKTISSNLIN